MDEWHYEPAHDLGLLPSQRRKSLQRESGPLGAFSGWTWRQAMRAYLRTVHRLRLTGRENLPTEPPYILVANHASHLDAIVLASAVPRGVAGRVFPLAAGDTFFTTPLASLFATGMLNALPLWRDQSGARALPELRERLGRDCCVYILFPEGTRSRSGTMGVFKPGLGPLVAGTPVPVVPCYLDGTGRAFPPSRSIPRPARIRVTIGAPLQFESVEDTRDGWRHIAQTTEAAVRALAPAPRS